MSQTQPDPTSDTERDEKATDILASEGIDADKLPDMANPQEWRDAPKQGGGA